MHSDLGRGVDGVVGVGLETRVHTTVKRVARSVEGRLSGSVVLAEEGEDDGIANGSLELLGAEGKTLRATDGDAVSSTAGTNNGIGRGLLDGGAGLAGDDGGRRGGLVLDGLGDGYGRGLSNNSGRGTTTNVDPEEVDVAVAGLVDTDEAGELSELLVGNLDALVTLLQMSISLRGSNVVNRLRQGKGGHAQDRCCRELHFVFFSVSLFLVLIKFRCCVYRR